ncbi:MAG: acyl-CoA carboxylase subunit beta [Deltaproteobacteria bacterium]|nr:acyl-CoA carboxylase subunit beta [Deltaproteobacteria bacterium]
MEEKTQVLKDLRERVARGGGQARIDKHHEQKKLTARERIDKLLDPGSFQEIFSLASLDFSLAKEDSLGDGVVTGHGKIDGRLVCVYAQDATIMGGSVGVIHRFKVCHTIDTAAEMGAPLIALNDSAGERIQKEMQLTHGSNFFSYTMASGKVPLISAILGNCAGNAVYGAALTDFIFMVDGISHMTITGPRVIKETTGEDISLEDLGGARVHTEISGCADFRCSSEEECLQRIRKLIGFLPSNYREFPPRTPPKDDPNRLVEGLEKLIPDDRKKFYDVHKVIQKIFDEGDFFEVKRGFGQSIVTGFARLDGYPVGLVANQPRFLSGSLTVDSSDKEARFIRFCDCFNLPIVFLIDVPGYFPGKDQEYKGIIRHGAKVLYAISESTVPKVSIIIRKAYGGGVTAMGGHPALGTDRILSWPSGEFAVMSPEAAVNLVFREEIKKSENPEEFKKAKIKEYEERFYTPYYSAASLRIHEVIAPAETRRFLVQTLELLRGKISPRRVFHGNIPL